ncbi:hypothetical protein PR048_018299 [Dryococelus australis]|uniref:Uncharacterized protein n=1 Tax=Dryococelus australis TaxID=614101 RepID=A0ABQ9HCL4_9NEOP|nr:hypothetical protein PR048_018299 [Dryococelus australis]
MRPQAESAHVSKNTVASEGVLTLVFCKCTTGCGGGKAEMKCTTICHNCHREYLNEISVSLEEDDNEPDVIELLRETVCVSC